MKANQKIRSGFENIIGKSKPMHEIFALIQEAADSDAGVVLYGESGTGKELIAKTIHEMSSRKGKAFVPVNCGAIPESIFESEFFGHRKGAFTGAVTDKKGFFDLGNEGTLFLDEVGALSANMQVKLLRAIEGGGYTPIGDNQTRYSDVRIIAATNDNLRAQIKTGNIREDFFYRIHIIPIYVPPLRDRKEDIPLLFKHFIKLYDQKDRVSVLPVRARALFHDYNWPGNVRELQNVIKRYVATKNLDLMEALGFYGDNETNNSPTQTKWNPPEIAKGVTDLRSAVRDYEKSLIIKALNHNHWDRARTAEFLNLPLRTLSRKMKLYGLT